MALNSIDHEHEFRSVPCSGQNAELEWLNFNTWSLLPFAYIPHTGHVKKQNKNKNHINHLWSKHAVFTSQAGVCYYLDIWWCLRHFPPRLWDCFCLEERVVFLCLGLLVFRVRFQNWEHEASKWPTLEEREEVGYPHGPTFFFLDRQPRLPLHRQYASDLRRVCVSKIKGFRWNPFIGPSARALAGTEGKEGIS